MSEMAALEDLLNARWSCRGYLPETVDHEVVERLLATAGRTPSWCNTQPWEVHVLSGAAARELSTAMLASFDGAGSDFPFPEAYTGVRRQRRRESGWQL